MTSAKRVDVIVRVRFDRCPSTRRLRPERNCRLPSCWNLDWQAPANAATLARISGRAQRSAIGLHGFMHGGFLVDEGKGPDDPFAPLLLRQEFPEDWPIVLVRPTLPPGLHGERERDAFADNLVVSSNCAQTLRRLLMHELTPSVQSREYAKFASSVYSFNRLVGASFAHIRAAITHRGAGIVEYRAPRSPASGRAVGDLPSFTADTIDRAQQWVRG